MSYVYLLNSVLFFDSLIIFIISLHYILATFNNFNVSTRQYISLKIIHWVF